MTLGDIGTHASFSNLDQLLSIITAGVQDIKRAYAAADQPFPDLQKPYTPSELDLSAHVVSQTTLVVAAASHLIRVLRPPAQTVIEETLSGPMRSAAIASLTKLHIPERLREAGPQGAAAHQLCSGTTANASKVARLLRFLASRHIFREVRPGVFTHNRISSVFDTGKSVKDILDRPVEKFNNSNGVSALAELYGTHALKAASMLPEHMSDATSCISDQQDHAPMNQALGFEGTVWGYYGRPENVMFQARFNAGMTEIGKLHPPRSILDGFPWSELAPNSTVVDVGGGVGAVVYELMQEHPTLQYIVQDLPPTIADAHKFWEEKFPQAITDGRIQLIEHDFFEPQPIQGATIYILRHIIHDWSTSKNRLILVQLRKAANANTRVVIMDIIVPFTSASDEDDNGDNTSRFRAPAPLLPSAGHEFTYDMDIHMLEIFNTQERTISEFTEMIDGTGWKIEQIYPGKLPGSPSKIVLAAK